MNPKQIKEFWGSWYAVLVMGGTFLMFAGMLFGQLFGGLQGEVRDEVHYLRFGGVDTPVSETVWIIAHVMTALIFMGLAISAISGLAWMGEVEDSYRSCMFKDNVRWLARMMLVVVILLVTILIYCGIFEIGPFPTAS